MLKLQASNGKIDLQANNGSIALQVPIQPSTTDSRKKIIKDEKVKALFDRYKVEY